MNDTKQEDKPKENKQQARQERLAAELRRNLLRRKAAVTKTPDESSEPLE